VSQKDIELPASLEERETLAMGSETTPVVLAALADRGLVARFVAANPNTPPVVLAALASGRVMSAFADVSGGPQPNPDLEAHAVFSDKLTDLLDPFDEALASALAENHNTPAEALDQIVHADDATEYDVPGHNDYIIWKVALNPNTMPETLIALDGHRSAQVRQGVMDNPSAPDEAKTMAALHTGPTI
jgi:hypothetical protein